MSGKKSPLSMVSPLTTREQRDRLVRRPIDRAEEEQDEADGDPGEVPRAPTARFLRSSLRSPTDKAAGQRGGRQFATSSPLDDVRGGIGGGHDDNTPGVSMITDEDARPRQAARGKPTTPRSSTGSAGSGKKRTSLRSKLDESSLLSLDTTEDEPEEEDDDDLQPAARITRRRPNKVPSPGKPLESNASQSLAKEEPEGGGWAFLFFLGIFLSLSVASVCLYLGFLRPEFFVSSPGLNRLFVDMGSEEAQVDYNRTVEKLRRQIVGLKEQFPSQEKKIWTTVLASLKGVLKPEPKQPSVILLIGDGKAFKSTQCLASKLSSLATVLLAESNDAAPQHVGSSFPSKSALHRQLESDLSLRSAFSLSHLELLPGSSAMALHAFCDNISAPYKRASIVLAVEEEEEGESLLPDVAAERVLTRSWSTELDEDRVSPLLSRLTVSVVRIAPEKNSPCS